MNITTTAFVDGQPIPARHSFDGGNVSPPLTFSETPVDADSLALLVEDPDAPGGVFTHWIVYNIPPATLQMMEGEVPSGALQGRNDFGEQRYGGPRPPSGTHRYFFRLFALDTTLDAGPGVTGEEFKEAIRDHVIDQAEIIGTFSADGVTSEETS